MTVSRLAPLALVLAAVVVATAVPAPGWQETFDDRSEVVVVEVPVNVTGRDGRPVRGLGADDFVLLDNGREQEVAGLEVVDLAAASAPEDRVRLDALPAVARRHFLFLFDLSFSSPTAVLRARRAARDFVLNGLHPSDLAAVATYSQQHGPRLVISFTPDRGQLAHAIDTLGLDSTARRGDRTDDPLRLVIASPGAIASMESQLGQQNDAARTAEALREAVLEDNIAVARQFERSEKAFERSRITAWSRSFAELASRLSVVPGRKHVVLFTEGFDSRLLLGRAPSAEDPRQVRDQLDLARGNFMMVDADDTFGGVGLHSEVGRMLEAFRRADCIIQAVDIAGLQADYGAGDFDLSRGGDALFYIANETGGELFEAANDLGGQLGRVMERSAVTYVLSFRPRGLAFDGRYHRLQVRVKGQRGARVSHREGWYEPRPFLELDPLERGFLASEAIAAAAPRAELGLDVLAAPFRSSPGVAYVPVILEVDGSSLLAGLEGETVPVEVYTYATDRRGRVHDHFNQLVSLDVSASRQGLESGGLKYYGHVELGPGSYRLRVLVRNAETGRTAVAAVPVEVPEFDGRSPTLLPPFFIDEPGRWLLVREPGGQSGSGGVVYPFVVDGAPYVPAARPRLAGGEEVRFCLVAYDLGRGELTLEAAVLDGAGQRVATVALAAVERSATGIPGVDRLTATFRPDGLAVGEYSLQVGLVDPATGARLASATPFSVID